MITAEELAKFPDTFNGDDAHLVQCIEALLSLDATGALVPHGIGGHARGLLSAAMHRLATQSRATGVWGVESDAALIKELAESAKALGHWSTLRSTDQETIDYWTDRVADLSRRLATPQPPKDAGAVPMPEVAFRRHENGEVFSFYDSAGLIRYGNAREAAARAQVVVGDDWQAKAAAWLEEKAVEQEENNKRWPEHAAAYKEWRDRPMMLRMLAQDVATPGEPLTTIKRNCPPPFWMFPDDAHPAHAGAGDAEALAKLAIDTVAKKLYGLHTDNHPTMHCNRFPAWSELKDSDREEWREKARRLAGGDHA